jgi:hypothetical protein
MRIPADVARVYEQAGPFATVYLDATRATGRGAEEVRLHWQALRAVLAAGDADEPTLRALDDAVAADRTPGEHGRVLVGAGGRTILDVALPRASIRPTQLARDVDELHDLGVDAPQPDRLDSAMVRAVAGTSAALLTVPPDDLSVSDGMAALLRQKH